MVVQELGRSIRSAWTHAYLSRFMDVDSSIGRDCRGRWMYCLEMASLLGSVLNRSPIPHGGDSATRLKSLFSRDDSPRTKHLKQMEGVSALFGVVDRIASGTASVDWSLYRSSSSGKDEDREQVTIHPALSVWTKPNPFYSQSEFVEAMQQHYELVGEYWWVIARSQLLNGSGPPIELWPVRPDRMRPVKDPEAFISGYEYRSGDEDIPLALDQVIYAKRQNPTNPYRGLSPIASLLLDMEGEQAAAEFNRNFFRNGAEPGGIIKPDKTLSDPEFDRMVERWHRSHRGVGNAHRVGILENAEFKERTYTHRDMQFGELRRFTSAEIMAAYGMPKAVLGIVEDVNRANAEASEYVFAKWLVKPRLEKLRDSLNSDFLPLFGSLGQGYEFDFSNPVPVDAEAERENQNSAVANALAIAGAGGDWDQAFAAFGLPAIPRVSSPEPANNSGV